MGALRVHPPLLLDIAWLPSTPPPAHLSLTFPGQQHRVSPHGCVIVFDCRRSFVMRGSTLLATLCFAIALPLASVSSAAGAPKNVNTSQTHGDEAETAIAINHANPLQITAVSNLNSGA